MQAILEIIKQILAAIPILNRWFTKTTSEKIEKREEKVRDDIEEFKKTGRPKWD
jgi:F0F1-type ATP synthase membrane subunit b/b'